MPVAKRAKRKRPDVRRPHRRPHLPVEFALKWIDEEAAGNPAAVGNELAMPVAKRAKRKRSNVRRHGANIMHSDANPGWGTAMIMREFAQVVLKPAAHGSGSIDIDYATSAYWQDHWPNDDRPSEYLDGSNCRNVLETMDREIVLKCAQCESMTGILNPPGLEGGEMVQKCWRIFCSDIGWGKLDSGVWVGFSIEQFASLQASCTEASFHWSWHPLFAHGRITTIVPSRRARYLIHPLEMIRLLRKKLTRHQTGSPGRRAINKQLKKLRDRKSDAPVPGNAPTHASYLTIFWSNDDAIAAKQRTAAREFLAREAANGKSLFSRVAIVGRQLDD